MLEAEQTPKILQPYDTDAYQRQNSYRVNYARKLY